MVSGESAGLTASDEDVQDMPEADAVAERLASLEKRLSIELKVGPLCRLVCSYAVYIHSFSR